MNSLKKQRGNVAIFATMFMIAVSAALLYAIAERVSNEATRKASQIEAHRLISVTTAIERFINDDDLTGTEHPLNQWNVAGKPFTNGAEHIGLSWLKVGCGETTITSYIDCNASDTPSISPSLHYRSVVENNGDDIKVTIYIENESNQKIGITTNGEPDIVLALSIVDDAEAKSNISNQSNSTNYFEVPDIRGMATSNPNYKQAVIITTISYQTDSTPFLRRDGRKTWTGDQTVESGRDVDIKNLTDIELSGSLLDTNSIGVENYSIDLDGVSRLRDVNVNNNLTVRNDANFDSNARIRGSIIDPTTEGGANYGINWNGTSKLRNMDIGESLETSRFLAKSDAFFEGNVRINPSKSLTATSFDLQGNAFIRGVLADPSLDYFLDMDGISRLKDISIGDAGDGLLSERLSPYVMLGAIIVKHNDLIPKPACTNGEPKLTFSARTETHMFGSGGLLEFNENYYFKHAINSGTNWQVKLETVDMTSGILIGDPLGEVVANIYCYYY